MKLFFIIATTLAAFAGSTLAGPVNADTVIYSRQLSEDTFLTLTRRSPVVSHFQAGNALGVAATGYHTAANMAKAKADKPGISPTHQANLKAEQSRHEVSAHHLHTLAKDHMAAHSGQTKMSDKDNEKHLKLGEEELKKAKAAQEALRKP